MSAVMLLNTVLFFVLLNIGLFIFFQVKDIIRSNSSSKVKENVIKSKSSGLINKWGMQVFKLTYPRLSEKEIVDLLDETWSRPYLYEPFTQFKERPYHGKYVNVSEHGFRVSKNQGPWPPKQSNLNIFLFGGSTTFGYGITDDQTIASHLQEYLSNKLNRGVSVYNFGRGYYYSTQERILLEQLLTSGYVPDLAIFIDGINDFYLNTNEPMWTVRFEEYVIGDEERKLRNVRQKIKTFTSRWPISRAIRGINRRLNSSHVNRINTNAQSESEKRKTGKNLIDEEVITKKVIKNYLENKKVIESLTASYNVQPVFVWQPVPNFKYDDSNHLFAFGDPRGPMHTIYGYGYMEEYIKANPLGENFLWCADIQQELQEPLYVDPYHYSSKLSKMLAVTIADLMMARKLLDHQ